MPSVSPAQHRWIGWLHSNPEARERSGMSQAKVDEWLHSDKGSPWKRSDGGWMPRRDTGGNLVDPTSSTLGGFTPSATTMNPLMQSAIQRYSGLSTEQLQELAARLGNTTQGQIVQRVLSQKRLMPNAQQSNQPQQQQQQQSFQPQQVGQALQAQSATSQPMQQQSQGFAYGGMPSLSEMDPWWTRREASSADSGFLSGSSLGRADAVKTTAPSGSYVLPADVVSHLGEGNSLAGARVWQSILGSGPVGTSLPDIRHGRGAPQPPHVSANEFEAKGGGVQDNGEARTPVALSHGEVVVSPQDVQRLGGGDLKRGHRILDAFVMEVRRRAVKKLKELPGPVGMKKDERDKTHSKNSNASRH